MAGVFPAQAATGHGIAVAVGQVQIGKAVLTGRQGHSRTQIQAFTGGRTPDFLAGAIDDPGIETRVALLQPGIGIGQTRFNLTLGVGHGIAREGQQLRIDLGAQCRLGQQLEAQVQQQGRHPQHQAQGQGD